MGGEGLVLRGWPRSVSMPASTWAAHTELFSSWGGGGGRLRELTWEEREVSVLEVHDVKIPDNQ